MAVTFTPPRNPSLPTSRTERARVSKTQFGDGYTQIAPDGLNNLEWTLEVRWENLTLTERDTIVSFFRARNGSESFSFTTDGQTGNYICSEWATGKNTGVYYDLSATFERVFF